MSYSVPTSPVVSRSSKAPPVTPQRPPPRQQPRSQSFYRSPLTPSTSPYTPISLRSFESASSTLTTPDNTGLSIRKRLAFAGISPDIVKSSSSSKDRSLADIAENWRSRASENGIKVSFADQDDSSYVLDDSSDMSLLDEGNDSSILSNDEAILAEPFLAGHRRLNSLPAVTNRPRAQSHTVLPSRVQPQSPVAVRSARVSPAQRRMTQNQNYSTSLMSTPPPNRTLAKQLKLKGCQTDPPQPRRREALGLVSAPSNHKNASISMTLEHDTSLDLFDIHENDLEYESDYDVSQVENSFANHFSPQEPQLLGYPTFEGHGMNTQSFPFAQPTFTDHFHAIGNVNHPNVGHNFAESIDHHFHVSRQQLQQPYYEDIHQSGHIFLNPTSTQPPLRYNQGRPQPYHPHAFRPHPHAVPLPTTPVPRPSLEHSFSSSSARVIPQAPTPSNSPTDCSVCLAVGSSKLAILQPCGHPLCSACLTSALNIVGEKDMQCAVCKQGVADFKLVMVSKTDHNPMVTTSEVKPLQLTSESLIQPLFASSPPRMSHGQSLPPDGSGDLESAFEFGLDFGELRASTPRMEQQIDRPMLSENRIQHVDNVVLRIDNVPWDITPTQIAGWLQQPVERVHVLLDRKGKTMSHAYVEVKTAATAGAILRGEAVSSSGRKERGSVLGKGRRARGVTITRSGQPELMADLFPHWRGNFQGSRPSLNGLDSARLIGALEGGLLSDSEIVGLVHLIREPDSHFLKVPSLPFHSLISWLSKFPTDVDSRVFWSASVRDHLFDATYVGIEALLSRVEDAKQVSRKEAYHEEYTLDFVLDLLYTGLRCHAFTIQQTRALVGLAEKHRLPLPATPTPTISEQSDGASWTGSSTPITPHSTDNATLTSSHSSKGFNSMHAPDGSLDDLAKEFGVDAQVVQALAQRLANLG
ncbi:hypothetical protein CPB83DRAFT_394674 [Crepidotus variabilis]|uniref:RING-type domain-containing protein n=1 Tax=Crepidotus variabilis TaxID=179855 RepID=A0A9P6EE48_9AGAR|nr:hypothetical protein CPB83DRAFT_394674 [Crepidotus variabilis]